MCKRLPIKNTAKKYPESSEDGFWRQLMEKDYKNIHGQNQTNKSPKHDLAEQKTSLRAFQQTPEKPQTPPTNDFMKEFFSFLLGCPYCIVNGIFHPYYKS